MSDKEYRKRKRFFPEMMYTHNECEAINRICSNAKYNYKDLRHVVFKMMLQNAPSNELKTADKDYIKYLESLQ